MLVFGIYYIWILRSYFKWVLIIFSPNEDDGDAVIFPIIYNIIYYNIYLCFIYITKYIS